MSRGPHWPSNTVVVDFGTSTRVNLKKPEVKTERA